MVGLDPPSFVTDRALQLADACQMRWRHTRATVARPLPAGRVELSVGLSQVIEHKHVSDLVGLDHDAGTPTLGNWGRSQTEGVR